jgi:prevent-host-death family protein
MNETQVSMTDLRQNLATLINRAAYGGERIVLISHGEPKAVIIGIEELRRLEQPQVGLDAQHYQYTRTLAAARRLRERSQQWREAHGIPLEDSAETLRMLREAHDDQLSGLR